MFELVREINRGSEKGMDIGRAQGVLKELAGVIGFTLQETRKLDQSQEEKILELISRRNEHRKAKEWKRADEVRDQLLKMGIAIEDMPKGTTWKIAK